MKMLSTPALPQLSGRGKKRELANALWQAVQHDLSLIQPNDVVHTDSGPALGPRIVARAILDLAKAPLEDSWLTGGLSESFIRKGQGSLASQDCRRFIASVNEAFARSYRIERCPEDIFERTFYSIEDVEQACRPLCRTGRNESMPAGLPVGGSMVCGERLERVDEIRDKMVEFAQRQGNRIFLLHGDPGDGKRSAFSRFIENMHVDGQIVVYVPRSVARSYAQLVRHLFASIAMPGEQQTDQDVPSMIDHIERGLRDQQAIIILNGYESLEPDARNSDPVIRDDMLFTLLEFLVPAGARGTCVFIGTTGPELGERHPLRRWANERSMDLGYEFLPALSVSHGVDLIVRNNDRMEGAETLYEEVIAKYLPPGSRSPSTVAVIALAAAFCFARQRGADEEWQPAIERLLRNDLKGLLSFALECLAEERNSCLASAPILIALCEDGLSASSLRLLLSAIHGDSDAAAAAVRRVEDGKLQPLILRGSCRAPDGGTELHFDTNREFRRQITRLCDERAATQPEFRRYHRELAALALRKLRETDRKSGATDADSARQLPFQFYRHTLAGLCPSDIQIGSLVSREAFLERNSVAYEELDAKVQEGGANAGQRFSHALMFFEREIECRPNDGHSLVYTNDEYKIELLIAAFHVGRFLPPAYMPPGSPSAHVPTQLQFQNGDGSETAVGNAWTLWLYREIAHSALRADLDMAFISANTRGEQLAATLGRIDDQQEFRTNWLSWWKRRAQISVGEAAGRIWRDEANQLLDAAIQRLCPEPSHPDVTRYRGALRGCHKIAGRYADLQAARGASRAAFDLYTSLAQSSLRNPLAGVARFPLRAARNAELDREECFSGASARQFLRFAWRMYRVGCAADPSDVHAPRPREVALFSAEELSQLVDLARVVLRREADRTQLSPHAFARNAAVAIERAASYRFHDLLALPGESDFMRQARISLYEAKRWASTTPLSVLARLRQLLEEARCLWHAFICSRSRSDRMADEAALVADIKRAVDCTNRVVTMAEMRRLPIPKVDALLLRAEIAQVCAALGAASATAGSDPLFDVRVRVGAAVTRSVTRRLDPQQDLARAKETISQTDYRKRLVEVAILEDAEARLQAPCAYFIS